MLQFLRHPLKKQNRTVGKSPIVTTQAQPEHTWLPMAFKACTVTLQQSTPVGQLFPALATLSVLSIRQSSYRLQLNFGGHQFDITFCLLLVVGCRSPYT